MPFQYQGNLESLAREVESSKDRVNSVYLNLLGKEKFTQLRDLSHRLLTPDCFFEDYGQIMRQMGYDGEEMNSGTGSSSCNFLTTFSQLSPNCKIDPSCGKTGVAFFVSEDSLKKGRSYQITGKQIAGYVHEFDHFVISSLQSHLLEMAHGVIGVYVGNVGNAQKLMEVVKRVGTGNHPVEDKEKVIALAGLACQYNLFCEQATRILDQNVLASLGINYDLPWRNKDPVYGRILVTPSPKMVLKILNDGDPFNGMTDTEAIDKMINWENFFQSPCDSIYSKNLLDSIKKTKTTLVPFRDYIKDIRKKSRKRR